MSETADVSRRGTLSLAIRYALRELRSGLRGFYVFIACIALGVMAIAGVGSVAAASVRDWKVGAVSCSAATRLSH
jgi:putative ABC transport system permease protein